MIADDAPNVNIGAVLTYKLAANHFIIDYQCHFDYPLMLLLHIYGYDSYLMKYLNARLYSF